MRVGVIGFGYIGGLHVRAWTQTPGVTVAAVADSRSEALARVPPGVEQFADYRELLALDLDAVSICSPTSLHCAMTLDALARGKHVLLEKPIAVSVQEARRMIDAAHQAGRLLFVGMTHRFYPEIREAKRLVDEGAIGDVVMLSDSILEHFGFLSAPRWYLDRSTAGGGTVLSSGIHLVDRVMWFAGSPVTHVAGSVSNAFFGGAIEDAAQMTLRFRSGVFAQISFGFLREPHPLVCDLRVVGTKGSLVVHTWQGWELHTGGGSKSKVIYEQEPHPEKVLVGLKAEVAEFRAAIQEGRVPWPPVEESTRALEVVDAFYRAAETGKTIPL